MTPRSGSGAAWTIWCKLRALGRRPRFRPSLEPEGLPLQQEPEGIGRRDMLKLMAASAALAGLTACTKLPTEKIVPYAQTAPEDFVPGKPLFYATAMPLAA